MRKFLILTAIFFVGFTASAQELNASVFIDAEQTGQPNLQVFNTLQQQLTEFLNNTTWTNQEIKNQERIDCNFTFIISGFDGANFVGSMQIQASRPVYGSTYNTPIYNYNDRDVSFNYKEFEPLNFNINTFESNLISLVTYQVYTVIGLDAATFELNAGDPYFETGKQIVNTASSGGNKGWRGTDGNQSRFRYNDALISNVYAEFHDAMYVYHREGLDKMGTDPKEAKNKIMEAIAKLKSINDRRPNSFLLRTFFDAKADELSAIFSGGPSVDITAFVNNLNRMAPTKRSNWTKIKS